jgi:hypothetical protein
LAMGVLGEAGKRSARKVAEVVSLSNGTRLLNGSEEPDGRESQALWPMPTA